MDERFSFGLRNGLTLIKRGDKHFVNEPLVGGGNPVASSKGTTYFNDILGTTVGAKQNRKYSAAALTAFGENLSSSTVQPSTSTSFFTGKPEVAGLGHAFLFRNYRASLGKWQTSDPLGYPDGWNQLAYCNNNLPIAVDCLGAYQYQIVISSLYDALNWYAYGCGSPASISDSVMLQFLGTSGYFDILDTITGMLETRPYNQSCGSFFYSTSESWNQGYVLGRNVMNVFTWVNWEATAWIHGASGWYRTLTGDLTMTFETSDEWDFEPHDRDSLWTTVVAEVGPGLVANRYSFIFTGDTGTPFPLEGKINDVRDAADRVDRSGFVVDVASPCGG